MYVDSAYFAKFYLNEPDSSRVRSLLATAETVTSSAWAIAEVSCALHRKLREGELEEWQYRELLDAFLEHVDTGFWTLVPISERLLRKVAAMMNTLTADSFLRSGDAVHLATASDLDETEIWSNDRHLLAAAPHFGLVGRSA